MTTQHAKSNAREGDGVADHLAELQRIRRDAHYWPQFGLDALDAAIAAMQAQQGAARMIDGDELLRLIGGIGGWANVDGDKLIKHSSVLELVRRRVDEAATGAPR
jgi:hypothetical protein